MRSNFDFVPGSFLVLSETAREAEKEVFRAPLYAAMLCRKSLEEWVRWLYEHDASLELPYDTQLSDLLHSSGFKQLVGSQFTHLNLIRKVGNEAVHGKSRFKPTEALHVLKLLHGFVGWVVRAYADERVSVPAFDETLVSKELEADRTRAQLKELEAKYQAALQQLEKAEATLSQTVNVPPPLDPNEDLTRKLYIDVLLREAGWDPNAPNATEYPVKGMPSESGEGRVDYVLWGQDGKPLALVEAKRTRRNKEDGLRQARLYADCLEQMFGQRPVIYCSNGFETLMWDDTQYPPRSLFGFYSQDELQRLIQRRISGQELANQTVSDAIADRYYQKRAIRAICEEYEKGNRSALLVMATGTGKTRTAAALIDLLAKAGWVKRILFLADRLALVHQAKTNLNVYLPNLPSVDLTREKEVEGSRLVFSTYQTLHNLIDKEYDGSQRHFGVGYFDLIIFDEVHRSVYNTYGHIFKHFDGLKVGLTATPRDQADRDTYGLFGLQPNNPTDAYELDQAVADQFLVPYTHLPVPTRFQRDGIRYEDLNEEEKREYEEKFADPATGLWPDEIESAALNQWLFNKDTVDKILALLMERGIKVRGGDVLGKTIVFARSHKHALFIQERFNHQFPEYKGHFLEIIDYQQEYKYDALNHFKDKDRNPQIAVSVDMLDTGIDIPEVVNLVFFKPVRSSTKFWQMIGRGTRLCFDLFGPGLHKTHFLIFDCCGNFEFFSAQPGGIETGQARSLSQRLFEIRLGLAIALRAETDEAAKAYGEKLIDGLFLQTLALNQDGFIVRQRWELVERYRDRNAWNELSDLDIRDILAGLGPLMVEVDSDEMAKRFDLMMLELQMSFLLGNERQVNIKEKTVELARRLIKKASIPSVGQKLPVIQEVLQAVTWENASLDLFEKWRIELRNLMKFLDGKEQKTVYTDFEDELKVAGEGISAGLVSQPTLDAYKRRIELFFHENNHHITLRRIRNNEPITLDELKDLERMLYAQTQISKDEVQLALKNQPLVRFIRSIVGLDVNAAKLLFSEFLDEQRFNTRQIHFINILINSLSKNGVIEANQLFEAPFTDLDSRGLEGLFSTTESKRIISLLSEVQRTLNVG